jgi:hypothetical protein
MLSVVSRDPKRRKKEEEPKMIWTPKKLSEMPEMVDFLFNFINTIIYD